MLRKCICLLWAVCVVMGTAGQARAGEQTGTIRIRPEWDGVPIAGGTISVSWVGTRMENGCLLTDGLANWKVGEEEFEAGDWISWLAQKNTGTQILCSIEKETGAVFTELPAGIYLVKQQSAQWQYEAFEPFYLTVPEGDNWDVYRAPEVVCGAESPRTGDHPAPIIGAMGIGLSVAFLMVLADKHEK